MLPSPPALPATIWSASEGIDLGHCMPLLHFDFTKIRGDDEDVLHRCSLLPRDDDVPALLIIIIIQK